MEQSLMGELRGWEALQKTFTSVFGEEALNDREFQKMKLKEYERIADLYKDRPLSRDEKAMQVMLKYQGRKLEKTIYPGLARRLARRVVAFFKNPIDIKRELAMVKQADSYPYRDIRLPVEQSAQKEAAMVERPVQSQQLRSSIDLTKRQRPPRRLKNRKGRSM